MNPQQLTPSARINAVANELRDDAEAILTEANNTPALTELTTVNPKVNTLHVIASPIFWLPVILSIVLTLLANWAINTFGKRGVSGAQIVNQVFLIILGVVVIYTAVRLRYIRREQKRLLAQSDQRIRDLNATKAKFVHEVYAELSDDVIHADATLEETKETLQPAVAHTLTDGLNRLKRLLSRFALLDSVYQLAPERRDFSVDYAVEEALYAMNVDHQDTSGLKINNQAREVHLNQDRHLVSKVFQTILASMLGRRESPNHVLIDGKHDPNGDVVLKVSGPSHDKPAEGLLTVYSASGNEAAGTLTDQATEQRLDLYLDRIIVDSLGGEISAKKEGDDLHVVVELPGN